MKRFLLLTLLCAGFLLAIPSSAKADRVLIVGDSHSGVLGPLLVQAYRDRGHEANYIRHNGWSSRSYRNTGSIRSTQIDLAVVILGGNNRQREEAEYNTDLTWVADQLRSLGAQEIVWFGPLWCTRRSVQQRHVSTRRLQHQILPQSGIRWFDMFDVTRTYRLRDGVHFTYPEYRRMVRNLFVPRLFP